jgi:hypothetical protein
VTPAPVFRLTSHDLLTLTKSEVPHEDVAGAFGVLALLEGCDWGQAAYSVHSSRVPRQGTPLTSRRPIDAVKGLVECSSVPALHPVFVSSHKS